MQISKNESRRSPEPFLKWAGGKRWLSTSGHQIVPREYNRYIEPFLGGGSVFFSEMPEKGTLSDVNLELTETYKAIRDDWQIVQSILSQHQTQHSKDYYYKIRNKIYKDRFEKAARFIYLNRTCWNGLYRVNLKGQFNVPIGTKSSVLLKTDKFDIISELLRNFVIENRDFAQSIKTSRENDFIFCDPPYTVKHNFNGFVKYNEKLFSWDDQIRLRDCLERAHERGTRITVTNADHESIREIYKREIWNKKRMHRSSVISASSNFRSETSELLIKNW
ncbi:DNA adenine methylase [Pyruvatibacter mobilis]|uniref:DNA adenine methylase n=1 Tax=Pyruvatibacter mobilis TaxID=1712261 RepID=UPI003BAC0F2C